MILSADGWNPWFRKQHFLPILTQNDSTDGGFARMIWLWYSQQQIFHWCFTSGQEWGLQNFFLLGKEKELNILAWSRPPVEWKANKNLTSTSTESSQGYHFTCKLLGKNSDSKSTLLLIDKSFFFLLRIPQLHWGIFHAALLKCKPTDKQNVLDFVSWFIALS